MDAIGSELARLARSWGTELMAGAATAGIPFATAAALHAKLPMVYVTREAKSYGNRSAIQGDYRSGVKTLLIDDASGNGSTKQPYCEQLLAAGLKLRQVVVLVGFGQQIIPWYHEHGIEFIELVQFYEFMDYLKAVGKLSAELHGYVRNMYQLEEFKMTWDEQKWASFLQVVERAGIPYQL